MKPLIRVLSLAALTFALFTIRSAPAQAEDSATTKVENTASDAKTDTKKSVRKMKRKTRKAAGTDTVGKDLKDSANDAKDNMQNTTDKTKNKINN